MLCGADVTTHEGLVDTMVGTAPSTRLTALKTVMTEPRSVATLIRTIRSRTTVLTLHKIRQSGNRKNRFPELSVLVDG